MPLLRVGRDRIAGLIVGNETCHWGTSGVTIFVSSSTAPHAAATTWLPGSPIGATGESGYPTVASNIFQHRGVFSTEYANFQWEAWLINTATASGAGVGLNWAAQQALGTKTSAQSWQITTCVTLTT